MLVLWFVGCFWVVGLIFFPPFSRGVAQVPWGLFPVLSWFFCVFVDADIPVESDTDDDGAPRISLAEMLEDLHISQDATGGEGAEMLTE